MHKDRTWKYHNWNITFEKEQMASVHSNIFNHKIQKTEASILN